MNAHDSVGVVVLTTQELLELRRFELLLPLFEMGAEIVADVLSLAGPADERSDFFFAVVQFLDEIEIRLQTAPFPREFLPFRGVGPDVGIRELLLYLLKGFFERSPVKDNLGRLRSAGRDRRNVRTALRSSMTWHSLALTG